MSQLQVQCLNCGTTFTAERKTARFCSVRCRVAKFREPSRDPLIRTSQAIKVAKQLEREARKARDEKRKTENAEKAATLSQLHFKKGYELRNLSVTEVGNAYQPETFDWIITDPPYPQQFLPVWSDLGRAAAHLLKPGGLLIALSGQSHLPEVMARLGEHLTYHWQASLHMPRASVTVHQRRVLAGQKPVLFYRRRGDTYAGPMAFDVFQSGAPPERERHVWEQSETGMRSICRAFVQPYDMVLDPFSGSGTTGVAVLACGGLFVGTDINPDCVHDAAVRLAEVRHAMTTEEYQNA